MATIEQTLWATGVKERLAKVPTDAIAKKEQMSLALALQQWTAQCITAHLKEIAGAEDYASGWEIGFKGKNFLGAVRWQEVDVWLATDQTGLALAVDPKHFQTKDSLKKNWKNGHNDLVAFATNLHERFPLCAVGGVIAFPEWAATSRDLKQMQSICIRSIPRDRPLNAYGKFEGFALAPYNTDGELCWPFTKNGERLKPENAFLSLANALYSRTLAPSLV